MGADDSNLVYDARWSGGSAKLSIRLDRPLDNDDLAALTEVATALGDLLGLLRTTPVADSADSGSEPNG